MMNAPGFRFFTPQTAEIFASIAACIVPASADTPDGAGSAAALAVADRALSERPAQDRKLLTIFLSLIERLPLLRYGRPFTKLPQDKQIKVLAFLESNRWVPALRQGFFGVKTFALLGYYGHPSSFPALGYPGPRLDAPYYRVRREGEGRP